MDYYSRPHNYINDRGYESAKNFFLAVMIFSPLYRPPLWPHPVVLVVSDMILRATYIYLSKPMHKSGHS